MKVKKASVRIFSDHITFKLWLSNDKKVIFAINGRASDKLVTKWLCRERPIVPLSDINRLLADIDEMNRSSKHA